VLVNLAFVEREKTDILVASLHGPVVFAFETGSRLVGLPSRCIARGGIREIRVIEYIGFDAICLC
jgi:hypothetical protein